MYLDEQDHVQFAALGEYSSGAEAKAWQEQYGEGVPEIGRVLLNKWVAAKVAYDANKGEKLGDGLPAARKAWSEAQ